jgi:hypothetical protein
MRVVTHAHRGNDNTTRTTVGPKPTDVAKENGMNRGTMATRMGAAFVTIGVAALAMSASLAVGVIAVDAFKPVTQDRLLRAADNPSDWLIYGGN